MGVITTSVPIISASAAAEKVASGSQLAKAAENAVKTAINTGAVVLTLSKDRASPKEVASYGKDRSIDKTFGTSAQIKEKDKKEKDEKKTQASVNVEV
jgi:hypothetical protein